MTQLALPKRGYFMRGERMFEELCLHVLCEEVVVGDPVDAHRDEASEVVSELGPELGEGVEEHPGGVPSWLKRSWRGSREESDAHL